VNFHEISCTKVCNVVFLKNKNIEFHCHPSAKYDGETQDGKSRDAGASSFFQKEYFVAKKCKLISYFVKFHF
jgi:hypothetical protein